MERKEIYAKVAVLAVIFGTVFAVFVSIKIHHLGKGESTISPQYAECAGKDFVIRGEFTRFDPSQMIIAIYLENTGIKDIRITKVGVEVGNNAVEKTLKHPVILKSGEGKYVYINITAFFRSSIYSPLSNENGPKKIIIYGDCDKVRVLERPPLGWAFFSYEGDRPLIPQAAGGAS